jgi:predicted negative regulator of RcsB-dependent stress response
VDHQTKVALKQDNFVTSTGNGLEWASANRRSVIITSALLLAVIIILVLGAVIYNKRTESASEAFGAAMSAYQTPVANPLQPAPPGVKTFPSAVERAKAANALFLSVASQYGMLKPGKNALYFAGLTYMDAGQNQSAEDTFKKVGDGFDKELGNLAKLSLSQLYRQTGRDPQAIELLKGLADKPSTTVPAGLAQLQLADIYTSEGKVEDARKIYAQLKDKDAKGAAGAIASQKLNPTAAPAGGPQ